MMDKKLSKVTEWHDVDDRIFREEILPRYKPAILKGFVKKWPAVQHALESPESVCRYLMALDNGNPVDAIMTPPEVEGRIFYQENMDGFNYLRNRLPISTVINQLVRYSQFDVSPSVAVQSALTSECLPGFCAENKLSILDESIVPRIWIGNTITTPAHFDQSNNIACVVSGKRRFTLFPPDQAANLYIGPLDYAPTPTPISMVSFKNPDFGRFPGFKDALAVAQVADMEAGDAIYIPTLWWHHVESLDMLNILVNYWWAESDRDANTVLPFECLLHCLRNMKNLPPEHREAWGALFNHFLFSTKVDPAAHIPRHKHGVLERTVTTPGYGHKKLK